MRAYTHTHTHTHPPSLFSHHIAWFERYFCDAIFYVYIREKKYLRPYTTFVAMQRPAL
jgi:hypothetical protein